jgi:hypothetical protein
MRVDDVAGNLCQALICGLAFAGTTISTFFIGGFVWVCGMGLHSSTCQLNLSLLCPFPLNLTLQFPPYNQPYPWMCPEGAQVEL